LTTEAFTAALYITLCCSSWLFIFHLEWSWS